MRNKVYDTARWRRLRELKFKHDGRLCEICLANGRVEIAEVVDHITPISLGGAEYPALKDLQSLCIPHHNKKTRAEQEGKTFIDDGVLPVPLADRGFDEHGNPYNPLHHWNQNG